MPIHNYIYELQWKFYNCDSVLLHLLIILIAHAKATETYESNSSVS